MRNPIFTTVPGPSTNPKSYGFVNSSEIIDTFAERGWKIAETKYGSVRSPHRDGFQKHIVKLENPEFPTIPGMRSENRSTPQIVLLNSHDATTRLRLFVGFVRIACLNGIIAGSAISEFNLIHSKASIGKLHGGIDTMLENLPVLFDQARQLQGANPGQSQIREYIKTMYDARIEKIGRVIDVNYSLPVLRAEDNSLDGFTVFNRVQEMLMRGGIQYRAERDIKDDEGKVIETETRLGTTRKLASVSGQLELNRMAYDKALEILAA